MPRRWSGATVSSRLPSVVATTRSGRREVITSRLGASMPPTRGLRRAARGGGREGGAAPPRAPAPPAPPGRRERAHLADRPRGRARQVHEEHGARPLAQPHAEVEVGRQLQALEDERMARLRRAMRGEEDVLRGGGERGRGGG